MANPWDNDPVVDGPPAAKMPWDDDPVVGAQKSGAPSDAPWEADAVHKDVPHAPVEPGAWNDPAQHSRFGNAAMGALMGGGADVIDTINRAANWISPEEHPELPGSVAYTANWLRSHAPQNAPAQGTLEKAEDLAGGVTGGFGPGVLEYTGKVPFAALHGYQTAEDEAKAQGRDATWGEIARDVATEAGGRKIMGALEAAPIGKLKKALGFGAVTGGQDLVEGKDKSGALQNAAVNTVLGAVLPGGEHGTETASFDPTTARPVGEPTAPSTITPNAAPDPGDAIGIKFPKGPSQRATVDSYWDNGQSVRVRYDDGRTQDMLTHEMMRDQTEPPPPLASASASGPGGPRAEQPTPDELFNLWDEADRAAPQQASRPPAPAPLGADAIAAVGRADALETQANDMSNKLSTQDREDMLLTAQRLRQQYGHNGAPPTVTPEDQARANSARAAAPGDRTLLDSVPGAPAGPAGFSPEEIAAAQQNTGTTPNLMGQEVPNLSRAPAQFSPQELAAAAAARQTQTQAAGRQAPGSGPLLDQQGIPPQARPVAPQPIAARPTGTDGRSTLLVPVPPRNAQTLMQWVRANGGIRDTNGDVAQMFRASGKRPPPGIIANQNGRGADIMAARARDAGYFPDVVDDQNRPDELTGGHLLDAIQDEINGSPRFSENDRDSVEAHEAAKAHNENIKNLAGLHGLDYRGTTPEAFHAAAMHSDMKLRAEDLGIKLAGNESPATVAALVHEKELAAQRPTQFPAQADAIDRHLDARFGPDLPDALDHLPWADEDAHTAAKAGVPPETAGGFAEGVAGRENPAGPTGERQAVGALGEGRGRDDGASAGPSGSRGFAEDGAITAGDLWKQTPEQLASLHDLTGASDHENLVRALGSEEAAKEFNRLDRAQNSMDPQRADKAAAEFDAKFGKLTPEQERLIYGIGETGPQVDDVKTVLAAHASLEDHTDAQVAREGAAAVRSASARGLSAVPEGRATAAEQAAFVKLGRVYHELSKRGVDPNEIPTRIARSLVTESGWKPNDADEIVGGFFRDLAKLRGVPGRDHLRLEEPTVERTDQGDQFIMPGAEHSAVQAAKARGETLRAGRPQKDADFGLFAKPDQQTDMFAAPAPAPKAKAEPGTLDDFHQFAEEAGHPVTTPAEANKAVGDYVITRGEKTGHEFLGVVDGANGSVPEVATSNLPNSVRFGSDLIDRISAPGDYVLHHNHPSSTGLSSEDLGVLGFPGVHTIVAHGHDGEISAASLKPAVRAALSNRMPDMASTIMENLRDAAHRWVKNRFVTEVNKGTLTIADANRMHADVVNRALEAAGILDHIGTRDLSDMDPAVLQKAIHDGAIAARALGAQYGLPVGGIEDVRLYRPAGPIQPAEGVAELSRRAQEAAAERSAGAPLDDPGQARDVRYPEADRNGQGRLLESRPGVAETDEERYRSERAGPQYASRDGQINMAPVDYDPVDDVSRQIAANSEGSGQPPGIVARKAAAMMPRPDQSPPTKVLGWLQRGAIMPRTLATMDWRSARFWQAWKEKDNTARALQHHWSEASQPYADLTADQRAKLSAVEELDRMQNVQRANDGRQIVARNEASARAEFSKPGTSVILDPQTTEVYHQRRALFRDVWTTLMQSSAKKLWPPGMEYTGTVDADEISKMAQATASKPLAKQLNNIAELMQAMDSQRNLAYTPLMRFGDYYIAIKPKPGTQGADAMDWNGNGYPPVARFELVDSRGADTLLQRLAGKVIKGGDIPPAATDRLADLKARYPESDYDVETGYLQRKADTLRKLDIPAIEKMFIALQQEDSKLFGPMVEEMRDKMYDELRAGFKKQATMVPGYSTDFGRVTGAYIGWTSNHAADLQHGDAIRSAQENYIDTHPDKNVRRYWDRWTDYQNNPAEEMQKLRQFGFYWQLAANPSSTLLIATHGPMVAHATLGAGVGYAAAGKHLYSAFGEALRNIGFDAKDGAHINMENMGRTPAEKALVKDALGTGLVHSSAADDLRGLGQGQAEMMGVDGKKWRRTLNILSSNIAVADQMNRVGTLLGSYRLASQPGMMEKIAKTWGGNQVFAETVARNGLKPETVAKFMVDEGLFVWGKRNRAPMQRGAGALLFQFKNFEANYLGTLWKFMSRMGPEGKVAGTFMLASLGAMGGALSLPFTDDLIKAGDWIGEKMNGIDPMIESKIYQLMENAGMSKMGAEAMLRGPSRSMLGIDLSSRLGLGEAVSRNMSALDALGTVPSMMISRLSSAWNRYQHGQPLAAAADLLPTAARNLVRGTGVLPQDGLRSQFGNQIITKDKLSGGDHLAASMGFEPAAVARAYEQNEFTKRTAAASRELTSRLTTEAVDLEGKIVDANKRGDTRSASQMSDRLQQIYRDNPEVKISRTAVRRGMERQVAPEASAQRLMPKALRNQTSPYVGP